MAGFGARTAIAVGAAAVCVASALAFGTNIVSNTWLLLVEPANHIPRESSVWEFEPTVVNDGSANYWIYGQDHANFYYFTDAQGGHVTMSRSAAARCPGFVPDNHDTWC
ncbi:MAG: hypothetical protein HYZ38_16465 [Mycobacterium sp.]|nr:hypothetical protein [Mycobacterium sp.]